MSVVVRRCTTTLTTNVCKNVFCSFDILQFSISYHTAQFYVRCDTMLLYHASLGTYMNYIHQVTQEEKPWEPCTHIQVHKNTQTHRHRQTGRQTDTVYIIIQEYVHNASDIHYSSE